MLPYHIKTYWKHLSSSFSLFVLPFTHPPTTTLILLISAKVSRSPGLGRHTASDQFLKESSLLFPHRQLRAVEKKKKNSSEPIDKTSERRRMAACHWPGQAKNKFFRGCRRGTFRLVFRPFGGVFLSLVYYFRRCRGEFSPSAPLRSFACQKHLVWCLPFVPLALVASLPAFRCFFH